MGSRPDLPPSVLSWDSAVTTRPPSGTDCLPVCAAAQLVAVVRSGQRVLTASLPLVGSLWEGQARHRPLWWAGARRSVTAGGGVLSLCPAPTHTSFWARGVCTVSLSGSTADTLLPEAQVVPSLPGGSPVLLVPRPRDPRGSPQRAPVTVPSLPPPAPHRSGALREPPGLQGPNSHLSLGPGSLGPLGLTDVLSSVLFLVLSVPATCLPNQHHHLKSRRLNRLLPEALFFSSSQPRVRCCRGRPWAGVAPAVRTGRPRPWGGQGSPGSAGASGGWGRVFL